MKYAISFSSKALKEFKKLPLAIQKQLFQIVENLADNPNYGNAKQIKGIPGVNNAYRIRSGVYRVIYGIFEERLCIVIVRAGHRNSIYKNLDSLKDKFKNP